MHVMLGIQLAYIDVARNERAGAAGAAEARAAHRRRTSAADTDAAGTPAQEDEHE
jgi:hypothetical protein